MEREKEELSNSCCCEEAAGESEGEGVDSEVKDVKGPVDVAERCSSCGVGCLRDEGEAAESRRASCEGEGRMAEADVLMCGCVRLYEAGRAVGCACDELRGRTVSGVGGRE